MAKKTVTFEMAIRPKRDDEPAYRWLYAAIRQEILNGRFRAGSRLPPTRDIADQYQLSRTTIIRAFEELKSEGYLEAIVGSGTYVSRVIPDHLLNVKRNRSRREADPSL